MTVSAEKQPSACSCVWLLRPAALARVGLLALGFCVLTTAPARAFLPTAGDLANQALQMVIGQINQPGTFEIRLGRVSLYQGSVVLADLAVADAEGVWFQAGRTRLDWSWRDALGGVARFKAIDIDSVTILRPPVTETSAPTTEADGPLPDLPIPGLENWPRPPIGVRVDRLTLHRASLEPPVLGRAAAARIETSFSDVGDTQHLQLTTETLDAEPARLAIDWQLVFGAPRLRLDVSLDQPAGGPFGAAAGLPPDLPVRLTVTGDGPLPGWTGRVNLGAGDYGSLLSDLALEADGATSSLLLAVSGQPGPALPDAIRQALGARPSLSLRAAHQPGTSLRLDDLRVQTRAAKATGTGRIALPIQSLDVALDARLLDPGALTPLLDPLRLAGATAAIRLTGPAVAPILNFDAQVTDAQMADLRVGQAALQGRVEGPLTAGRLEASGQLSDLGPDRLHTALGESMTLRLRAEGDATRQITLTEALLTADAGRLEAAGNLDLTRATPTVTGTAEATLPSLARFAPLLGERPDALPLSGAAAVHVTADAFGPGAPGRVTVRGRLTEMTAPDPLLAALLGDHAAVEAGARWPQPERLTLTSRLVSSGGVEADLDGDVSPAGETASLDYRLSLSDLRQVSRVLGVSAAGALAADGRLQGPLADPSVSGSLAGRDLAIEGRRLGTLTADYRVQRITGNPAGRLDARLRGGLIPLTAGTSLESTSAGVSLRDLAVRSGDNRLTGDLRLPTGRAITGDLRLEAPALTTVLQPLGIPVAGAAAGQLRLTGNQGRQSADLTLDLKNISAGDATAPSFSLAALELEANATQPLGTTSGSRGAAKLPSLAMAMRGIDGRVGSLRLRDLQISLRGPLDALASGLEVRLARPDDGALTTHAVIDAADSDGIAAEISVLSARYADIAASLRQPARLFLGGDRQSLEDLRLDLGGGTIAGDLSLTRQALRTQLTLSALPLSLLQMFAPVGIDSGRLDGTLSFVGSGPDAGGRLDATITDLAAGRIVETFQLNGRLTGDWDGRRAEVSAHLQAPNGATDLDLSGQLALPVDPKAPFPTPPPDADLRADLRWTGRIAPVWALVPAPDHLLSGQADLNARIAGTLAKPRAEGRFVLAGGTYENLLTGTILKDLSLDARLTDDLRIPWQLSATDGGRGRLTGDGQFAISADPLADSRAEINADRLLLVRRDDVTARGSGQVTLAPSPSGPGAELTGRFETRTVEVRLVNALPPQVVAIDIIRSDQPPPLEADAAPAGPPIALDLTLSVPGRAFVRGRGADMEWRGQVTVTGTAAEPVVHGRFEALQGLFDFIGNSFTLEKGIVTLPSQGQPQVDLDFARTANGYTGHVLITGSAAAPDISFRSQPSLPESEVLPRLLFGENQQSLGAAEALTLAQGLETLSSGRPGLADRLRRSLRLDVLRVDTAEKDGAGPTVTVGRRVGGNVFVGARQPTSGESGSVFVEIEVLPDVTVETEVGATGESDASIVWEYKY